MEYITYSQKYEDSVIELWNKVLPENAISLSIFRRQILFDENFDTNLCYLALDEGLLVGFILGMKRKFPYLERGLEPDKAWISVVFVDDKYQRRGIGTKLVGVVEEELKKRGTKEIIFGAYSPNYFFRGVDKDKPAALAFFKKMGYIAGEESYSMYKDLNNYVMSEEVKSKKKAFEDRGFSFVNFTYDYALELLEFLGKEFGGGWKRNCLMSMQKERAEDCILLVLDKEKNIVGFCVRMTDENPMRFGPFGIAKELRNEGLGGVLFEVAQEEMHKRHLYQMYFMSTDAPGRRFYERHGVKVFKTYVWHRKNIE